MMYQLVARNKGDIYNKALMVDVIGEERSIWNLAFYLSSIMETNREMEIKVYDLQFHDLVNYKPYPFQDFRNNEEVEKFYGTK